MLIFDFTDFPILQTERLLLRQINKDDADEMFALRSNPEIMKYIPREMPKTIDDAIKHIEFMQGLLESSECINWAICLKEDNKLIGNIGYFRMQPENHRAEIGYMLDTGFHGKGIMQEALTEIIKYGFETMKLHSIEAVTDPENYASWKLLEKNGFIREGHFKEDCFWQGKYLDSFVYSLLNK
ncbi:N-acetyltransferase GCN5 [Flavobacterium saliperosum S13]|uniref:Ribosomal-protein-alanine N-acetyltransferase n=2 Tax=Flavobacterium saliperosum TaxID=329186 RepID=A0A1G4VEG1_9FLAO|nr:GNAT family N-acetyltransferase [Flavobacterium saliperosum]ESU25939.1 N-acetyltransferase GCN5 [Flavobacterium saliperosum S13]SCX05543.1 ribosomal-protein-alanine N-acetyltransferase [Flavobacterium saliperosum]